jgi:mercuric transport protein
MTRRVPISTAVLALWVAGFFVAPTAVLQNKDMSHAAEAKTIELAVEGMTCAACTFAVKAALKKLDGVEDAKVSFGEKNVVVTYDPDRVTPRALVEAVDETGFSASLPAPPGE